MDFQAEIDLLSSQLNIPNDKFNQIITTICRNFVKKYQKHTQINPNLLSVDLRKVISEIEIYSQYTCETISKYKSLNKLQTLVRSIIQGQSMVLTYVQNLISQQLQDRSKHIKKIESMTGRIYERCQNCAKPLQMSQIKNIQDQIGLKFRDIHQYFQHDLDQINKLSQQASLIYRKRALNIQGIAEQLYMQKFEKMQQNITTTIQHVTQSLNNITVFQQKFNQMQQYQFIISKNDKQNVNNQLFNSKKYAVNYSKHFYNLIKNLQDKLSKIKSYFIITTNIQTQTNNQFNQCTPQKLKQLKQQLIKIQVQKKQLQIYVSSLEQQLTQNKVKNKIIQQNLSKLKIDKQKSDEKIKYLQAELEMISKRQAARRKSLQSSQKIIEAISNDKYKQGSNNSKNTSKNTNQIKQDNQNDNDNGDIIVENQPTFQNVSDYSNLINQSFNQTRSKRQSKMSNVLRKQNQGYYQKQGKNNLQSRLNSMANSIKAKETATDDTNVYQNARKIVQSQLIQQRKSIQKPIGKKLRQTRMIQKIHIFQQRQLPKSSNFKKQEVQDIKDIQIKKNNLKFTKVYEIKIGTNKKSKNNKLKDTNKVIKMINEKMKTERSQRSVQSQKQNHIQKYTINQQLQQVYKILKNTDNIKINQYVNYKQFKSKFNNFLETITGKPQNIENFTATAYVQSNFSALGKEQFHKTQNKMKTIPKINQQLMKVTQKDRKKFRNGFTGPITEQNDPIVFQKCDTQDKNIQKKQRIQKLSKSSGLGYWNKTNTQSNYDQGFLKIKQSIRKSSNTIDQQSNPKILMKLQKFNGFASTDNLFNSKNFMQNLPILKKKYRQQSMNYNSRKSAVIQEQIDIPDLQYDSYEFNEQDIKLVYHSIENAYEIGQISLKHRKSQSCILKQQQPLTQIEINYMKVFFTKMANIHLVNKLGYQNIKMFLICPYDSIISQMTQLNLVKSGNYSNAMRQSLKKILLLHRNCTVKGQLCRHLRYLIGKVAYFERRKQLQEINQR